MINVIAKTQRQENSIRGPDVAHEIFNFFIYLTHNWIEAGLARIAFPFTVSTDVRVREKKLRSLTPEPSCKRHVLSATQH